MGLETMRKLEKKSKPATIKLAKGLQIWANRVELYVKFLVLNSIMDFCRSPGFDHINLTMQIF
jgi:hypothetical protein